MWSVSRIGKSRASRAVKYHGFSLGDNLSFEEHVRKISENIERFLETILRLMTNVRAPGYAKQVMLC